MSAGSLPNTLWPSVNFNDLRHQIAIVNPIGTVQDAAGQPVSAPTTVRTCWGGINLVGMKEVFGENQLTSQSTDTWTVRWTSTVIQPGMQITFGSSLYRIQAVQNVGKRNILLHLLCLELNAAS